MKPAKPNANAYLQTKVLTASPAELRLMLFEGAIRFAQQAHQALQTQNLESAYVGITRCQDILIELINGLKPEHNAQLCDRLSSLYTYMYTRLMHASAHRDPAVVAEVITLLNFERDTWSMLLEQLAAENRAASTTVDVPHDVAPNVPPQNSAAASLVGGTVSVQG